jgi:predicted regulator of Ras-like GTPase activity (Roadblock/LC7/MglB family)/ribosomal protein L40E
MIICSNCGATNNEADGNICRKCGALLPISTRPPRIRLTLEKKKKESKPRQKTPINKPEVMKKPKASELQEIPLVEIPVNNSKQETKKLVMDKEENDDVEEEEKEILTEITPKPFEGSIIGLKGVYSSKSSAEKPLTVPKAPYSEGSLVKQKQLEEDMTKVLTFLSKKITVKKLPTEKKPDEEKKKEEFIPPSSMNEILTELLKLDLHIEASAIIKKDGTILASAISSRMSDNLFATIGQNLSMIGEDIIEGLSAGKLLNISVRGSKGVVDLAPIDTKTTLGNDMILVIFSSPRIKSGIINFAANIVKKQVKEYLGLDK